MRSRSVRAALTLLDRLQLERDGCSSGRADAVKSRPLPATYLEPRGGAFGEAASAWLKWQLKGDQTAARMFTGDKCGLCADLKWTVEKKRIP